MSKKLSAEEKEANKLAREAAKAKDNVKVGGAKPKNATEARVLVGGEVIRTYSLKEHGENFADNAKEFASKQENRKVELA